MKLKRHIKSSLIHTFKQFKIKNKSRRVCLINNLKLVENSHLSKSWRWHPKIPLWITPWTNLHSSIFLWLTSDPEQKSKICSSGRGSSQETQKGDSSRFNKNKWVTCEWPICKRERERAVSSRLVKQWDEVGQSVFLKFCVIYFRDIHPIHVDRAQKQLFKRARFEVRKGY